MPRTSRPAQVVTSSDLPFWSNAGTFVGEATTASTANAGLFADGFRAGYHGSKAAHSVERDHVRKLLAQKYGLQ